MSKQLPLHALPLPVTTLQASLPRIELDDAPSAQRRSTTFPTSTLGIWARNQPLWASWPPRITREDAEEMGLDVQGGKITVDDVLAHWECDVLDSESPNGLVVKTSKHRLSKMKPQLLGVSESALHETLPHLDVSSSGAEESLIDLVSGRKVLMGTGDDGYGSWSTRYVGHQFGSFAGQLGDGRAISLLETVSDKGRQEIQIKGGGRTPFSRSADGLAVLRSGVREYLGCEAIAALGIPTTRSLALLTHPISTLPVMRENGPEPPSVLARVAPSFIRIGHFQAYNPGKDSVRELFFWRGEQDSMEVETQGNLEGLRRLVGWIKGDIMGMGESSVAEWVREVAKRNAEMVAAWQVYGFCHGVLNTDNISVLGLTIDYGPYAFMDIFDENHICNHSDPTGLYSYRNQPSRVLFALDKLVNALLPIVGCPSASEEFTTPPTPAEISNWTAKGQEAMKGWEEEYHAIEKRTETNLWLRRFGLIPQPTDERFIVRDFLTLLATHKLDFHTSFRKLSSFVPGSPDTFLPPSSDESAKKDFGEWFEVYARRIAKDGRDAAERKREMDGVNPRFVLRQWVLEEVIERLEDEIMSEGVVGKGKNVLAKIMEMSTNPFRPYGEDKPDSELSEEEREERRLCGLGAKEMLGFQCSCSS
ncbi:hypothetical protein P7C73_g3579, partial [Tremellales sp. Uapishka_1]